MIFNSRLDVCPMCGVAGKEFTVPDTRNCPQCGTVFNQFGVVLALEEKEEGMELN